MIEAYKQPNVDESKDSFTWGEPNFTKIREYASEELNWSVNEMTKYVDIVEKRV